MVRMVIMHRLEEIIDLYCPLYFIIISYFLALFVRPCYSANHVQYLCQKETLCGNGEGPMDAAKTRKLTSHKLVQSSLYHIIFFNVRTTTNKNNATKQVYLPVHNQIETYITNTRIQ